ncbi:MAG: type IX secretion system sortase PorU [Bacteroidia bacterium]
MLKLIITNFLIFAVLLSFGTTQISKTKNIIWKESINISSEFEDPLYILNFEGAGIEKVNNEFLPCYTDFVEGNFSDNSIVTLKKFTSEKLTVDELKLIKSDKINVSKFETVSKVLTEKKQRKLWFKVIPFIKNGNGEIEKLISFEIDVVQGQMQRTVSTSLNFASNSVLVTGTWYRIGVPSDGMYKLDYKFLSDIGIDMATLNPQYIRLYGNGGKQLPFSNSVARFDDLIENSIVVQGENDGIFDAEDFVVFYGQTPNEWKAGDNCSKVSHRRHFYSDTTYYFLNTDIGSGLRMPSQNQSSNEANRTVTSFDEYQFYENEAVNLISSGRQWLGEKFDAQTSYNFDFNFPNISISDSVYINTKGLVRSSPPSTFKVSCQGASSSFSPISVNLGNYTSDYGKFDSTCFKFIPNSSTISVKVDFTKNPQYSSAVGYLDYIEVVARRNLKLTTNYIKFKDKKSVGTGNTAIFNVLDATANTRILDITNPLLPMFQTGDFSGNTFSFKQETSLLREYVAFNMVSSTLKVPTFFGKVTNQNLHALGATDLIIVSHPLFYSEALRLKNLHTSTDGLKTVLVTPQEIYNEFSSGSQDITAIKTFCKMFYDRATSSADAPKYLLLFGDASYNNRERSKNGNTNFIPSYQSLQSMDLTLSYISDDYFGLLDNNESEELQELMDIGIGRLPAKSLEEAKIMVNKIIEYETKTPLELNTNTNFCAETGANISGDWKNVICFVGDDQDRNTHLRDADKIATFVDTSYNNFNIEKIYFDTYKQVVNAGGQRFPDVKQAINSRVERGALIINYTGHGGESGWAQERVLEISDIKSWKNKGRYPFFVTATCEFARFDDPLRTSGGEDVILQEDGGGIGLLTTTRLVYSAPNFTLNKEFFNEVFVEDPDGRNIRMGEVSRLTKNQSVSQFTNNHRNFTLLGDPAMRLNFAKEKVVTTSIEVVPSASSNDTLKALSKVKITGFIANKNNIKLSNFNGLIYPIVFDKASSVRTIVNDSTGGDISLPTNVLIQKI